MKEKFNIKSSKFNLEINYNPDEYTIGETFVNVIEELKNMMIRNVPQLTGLTYEDLKELIIKNSAKKEE